MQQNLREAEQRIEEARRTQAESLDLGDLALSELPASLGDLPQLRWLSLGKYMFTQAGDLERDSRRKFPAFTDLSPLFGLQGLQGLDLSCTVITDLSPLAGLHNLQGLYLRLCLNVTDLAPLARLQKLQNLDLQFCASVKDLAPLAGLQQLQSLTISVNVTDLTPLAGLQGLQSLTLSSMGITNLAPLAKLQKLQTLEISVCTEVRDLAPLAGLQRLKSLNLHECTRVAELAPLAGLHGLQSLDLSECNLTDLAPLAGLQGLQSLKLRFCRRLTDLSPLASLQGLQSLDLYWCEGVTDLVPLAGLQDLKNLKMNYCQGVTDLAPLAGLRGLQSLDLRGCRPAVQITLLRIFADHPHLTWLTADKAVGVPREILSHYENDNCLPRLRSYLAELDLGAEAENEVKVILLGNGRVGKTQLCRRFRGQPFDQSIESTHGVQIWREELRIRTGEQEQVFQVNWWDFGGQDIYHGTHALFLRSRAVFLILWTPQLENRDEYLENGIILRNQPLAYWLDYVRSLAGEDSPVIVVQSQCDQFADRRPSPSRPDGFGFFESCSYSAKQDLGRETLEGQLRDAMRYLLERNGMLEIGRSRAEVRRWLYDWRSDDQERRPGERRHRTFTLDGFRELCGEVGGIVSWEHALSYFHQTGVVFYQPELFSNCIVLDQDWALGAIYAVFHRGRAAPLLRDSGRFTREDLALMVWQEHSLEEQTLFLGLMESCSVCFRCGETAEGETRYVAPDLLPRFEAVKGRLHAWNEDPGTPTLRLEYRFFHQALIRRLMSRIGQQAGDLAEYWKYGFWFKDGQRDTQLLVQLEDNSTDVAPGAGALVLKAQGRDPLGLMREIRKAILWQRIGEKPDELLTLEGTTVARSALANVIEGRVLDRHRKPAPAAAFAAFFHDLEQDPGEIDIKPLPLTECEKPREVFISYAWGDDTPEGKIRVKAVDELQAALVEDGFQPVRDRDRIQPGERISAFIRQLTRADLVVAVISDKYLRSSYCMYEIYRLWQKHQGNGDELARCLVPIVLPEVKVGNLRERVPYLEYWADQAESLEALVRNPKLRPSSESWEEVRLVQEFAHHVDDILVFVQDILMPRKLEAHLDDGFQTVREALRRRMRG
ncbi:MAG: internalin [Acidobacteriota bacterium]|nr:internalin [Acidobacteriota bacterium]